MLLRHLSRPAAAAVTVTTSVALLVPASLGVTAAHAEVDAPPAATTIPATAAERALQEATRVMAGTPQHTSPTLALRDLALALDDLSGRERARAEALLARPNEGVNHGDGFAAWTTREAAASRNDLGCSTDPQTPVCVHWTNKGADAPEQADTDGDNVPNWVEVTLTEMEHVWDYEVNTLGYRRPMTDERGSIDNKGTDSEYLDVYLSDIGSRYYGYCGVDDTRSRSGYRFKDRSGYCVLDDDYAKSQFSVHTPRENLQVTAAHEFFHAIQFAYDATEDLWLMEASATWMEDEVYTDVNDNRQYLASSQFRHPRRALDHNRSMSVYGSWGFLRYMSERFGVDLIRRTWERADGAPGGPDDYSLVALRRAVTASGGDLQNALGTFGLALNQPEAFITEGSSFPSATVDSFTVDRDRPTVRWQRYSLDHLSYAPIVFRPGDRLASGDRLRITVDAPARASHPEARVMVVRTNGEVVVDRVPLDRKGGGTASVKIGGAAVERVVLSLANTSTDLRKCFSRSTPYSCKGGIPVDDGRSYWFRATLG